MSRVTDGWNGKIDEFEKMNQGLQDSLSKLRDENELLRLKVSVNSCMGLLYIWQFNIKEIEYVESNMQNFHSSRLSRSQ